ncbi:MAG: signal peptidase I [Victivallales bacterium]|nr:signal peptidase I [Victivallales bacterium]
MHNFILPKITWKFGVRLALIAIAAWFIFSKSLIVSYVNGDSMLPTYHTGNILICWTMAYRNHPPQPGDIVMISYSGHSVMLLKRVVAVAGETVQFHDGKLLINGNIPDVPWASSPGCEWESKPLTIAPGCVYVVGDNRSMPIQEHLHGEISITDIVGKPLF